jgi:hypothetical protein
MLLNGSNTATSAGAEKTVAMWDNACMANTVYLFIITVKFLIIHGCKDKYFLNMQANIFADILLYPFNIFSISLKYREKKFYEL